MTEIKTFKLEQTFKDIDDLYEFLLKDVEFVGKYCAIRIEKPLKERPFCITGVEEITKRQVLFYCTKETMPENIGELVYLQQLLSRNCSVFSFKNKRYFVRANELASQYL